VRLSFVFGSCLVESSAVISPRKFFQVAAVEVLSKIQPQKICVLLWHKFLRQRLRGLGAAFSLAATENLQSAAFGKNAVNSTAIHQPNKALKVVRCAHWTRHCVARPLARR